MDLQLPPDLQSAMQPFLAGGRYANEAELLRDALAALKRAQDDELAAIRRGLEDEQAGRIFSARDVVAAAKSTHQQRSR